MTVLELITAIVGAVLGLSAMGALFVRLVALPYLELHLIRPLLARLDAMSQKDADLETATKIAATMFEGHMEASAEDRRHLWSAVEELQKRKLAP